MFKRINFGWREEQPAVLGAERRAHRFDLARQHGLFVAVAEDVFDHRFYVLVLRAAASEVLGVDRVRSNALEEEATSPLLAGGDFVPPVADGRDRSADVRRV